MCVCVYVCVCVCVCMGVCMPVQAIISTLPLSAEWQILNKSVHGCGCVVLLPCVVCGLFVYVYVLLHPPVGACLVLEAWWMW